MKCDYKFYVIVLPEAIAVHLANYSERHHAASSTLISVRSDAIISRSTPYLRNSVSCGHVPFKSISACTETKKDYY